MRDLVNLLGHHALEELGLARPALAVRRVK
jgi:hypothetical protein